MKHILALALLLCLPSTSRAFVFSDGTTATCITYQGRAALEVHYPSGVGVFLNGGYAGLTTPFPDGSVQISYDDGKLNAMPPPVHDFTYFHECAHAHVPSPDELIANCVGLTDMRAAGRSSPASEDAIYKFQLALGYMGPRYGEGGDYWKRTLECANKGLPSRTSVSVVSTELTSVCQFTVGPRAGLVADYDGVSGVIPAPVGTQCHDGAGSYGLAVPPSTTTGTGVPTVRMSTKCHFDVGPRAGRMQDYAPFAPMPVGAQCMDGLGSFGHVIK